MKMKKDKRIYFKNSNGFEELRDYDENGNMVYRRDSDGEEEWHKYYNNDTKYN